MNASLSKRGLRGAVGDAWNSGQSRVARGMQGAGQIAQRNLRDFGQGLDAIGSNIVDGVDGMRTGIANRGAVDRLEKAMTVGTDGDVKFARMTQKVFDDINSIRVDNGLEPLTQRQATAYKNTINNSLSQKRIAEGHYTPRDIAEMAFDSLTSDQAFGSPGKGSNQFAVSPRNNKYYNASGIGLAEDGGTSLKSIEPRRISRIDRFQRMGQQKDAYDGVYGTPLAANQEGAASLDRIAPDTSLSDQRPGDTGTPLGTRDSNIAQGVTDVNQPELRTSTAGRLRTKRGQALLDQYGSIDKPMARSADAVRNVQRVADAGFTRPQDVEDIISKVTGADGKVTRYG